MERLSDGMKVATHSIRSIPQYVAHQPDQRIRYDELDIARGVAIVLMILSHTAVGLNSFKLLPSWGLVPIHLLTKFSSTLFIFVFGLSVSLFYVSAYGTSQWKKRWPRLLWRSFVILVWYKILTVVQMFEYYSKDAIVDRLLFREFTDFAEVLNFYWLAILWILLLIPIWVHLPKIIQLILVLGVGFSGVWLNQHFDFWGVWQIKAILVEYKGVFCFGQFQRGALALLGLFLGGLFLQRNKYHEGRYDLGWLLLVLGMGSFLAFILLTSPPREKILMAIAKNAGKHPPELFFSLFSFGGAMTLAGLCMMIPEKLRHAFFIFRIIGKEAFFCFNLHLLMIFLVFRYWLDLRWDVTYTQTLLLFGLIVLVSTLLAPINGYIKKQGALWKWILP